MVLALDLGTTNAKALVTDRAGRRLGEGACPVQVFSIPGGGAEQDIEEIWEAALTAIHQAVSSVDRSRIQAIGLSSQGGAMQILDAQAEPLGRTISWQDQRGRPFDDAFTAEVGPQWFLERVGHGCSGLAIGQLLRLRNENPGLLAAPNRIGFVGDIITSRLCGRAAHDGTSCALTLLYNPNLRNYDRDLLKRLQVSPSQLPDLVLPREPAGRLVSAAAREIGLRPGIPVSAAIHDQYAAALGAQVVQAGMVMVGTGTAWVLLAINQRLTPPVTQSALVCHHLVDGLFGQIVPLAHGGSAMDRVLKLTGNEGKSSLELDLLFESAPPGSGGLQSWSLLDSLAPGHAPEARVQFSDIQLARPLGHLVRGVLETLAFELRRQIELLRDAGLVVEQLVLSGSAAASRVTPQMLADVTGIPLMCTRRNSSSSLGAAIIARGLLEPASSLAELADEMAPAARHVQPASVGSVYEKQFGQYLRALPLLVRHHS